MSAIASAIWNLLFAISSLLNGNSTNQLVHVFAQIQLLPQNAQLTDHTLTKMLALVDVN